MEKVLQELFWAHFLGAHTSNGTKIHLDVALLYKTHKWVQDDGNGADDCHGVLWSLFLT